MPSVISAGTASNTALTLSSDTSGELQIRTNNGATTAMTLTTGGNVGIGTTSPTGLLQLSGSTWRKGVLETTGVTAKAYQGSDTNGLNFTSNIYWSGSAWVQDDATRACFAYIQHLGNNQMEFRVAPAGAFSTWTTAMVINTSGNVGIGTSSPSAKLDVNGTLNTSGIVNINGSGGGNTLNIWGTNGVGIRIASTSTSTSSYITQEASSELRTNASGFLTWYTGGSEKMRIDSSGNVQIGSTDGGIRLRVREDSTSTTAVAGMYLQNGSFTTNTQVGIGFINADNFNAKIYSLRSGSSEGNIVFATNSGAGTAESNVAERMRITSGGNVGIGTTNPSYRLSVSSSIAEIANFASSTDGYIRITQSGAAETILGGFSTTGFVGTVTNHDFVIRTSNTERMRITSGGDVLVGKTTSSSYPLQAKGAGLDGSTTVSVSSGVTTTIYTSPQNTTAMLCVVFGDNGSVGFCDLVIFLSNTTPVVISSNSVYGSPPARTYSNASVNQLRLNVGTGSSVRVAVLGTCTT